MAIEKLREVCLLAVNLIKIVSFVDAQDLPFDLLSGALSLDAGPEELSGLDDLDLLDALEALGTLAIIIPERTKLVSGSTCLSKLLCWRSLKLAGINNIGFTKR